MSSQAPSTTPASSPAPHGGTMAHFEAIAHGGAMDPNEVRLRQIRAQQNSASSAHPANSPDVVATGNPLHGGDMDPNEVRLRLARLQQASGHSSPTPSTPEPNNAVTSHAEVSMRQAEIQSAQYGSSSHLINTPYSPPSAYSMSQTAQTGQYFPAQHGHQPPNPVQAQPSPQSPYSGLPTQVNY